jgi:hypothetical protein
MNTNLTCECNGKLYKNNTTFREHKISKSHKDWELQNNPKEIPDNNEEFDTLNEKYNTLIQENEELKKELIKVKNSYLSILFEFNKY